MKKIREEREQTGQGYGGGFWFEERVRKLDKDEEVPAGAELVPDDTPVHDWRKKENA